MILAHLSDLHLGFRAYGRIENGYDVRERDVAAAFERAIEQIVRIAPDLVVVSGDVFDRPDPPASAVVALARGLETFRMSLPDTHVLMVAGPRDTPRRSADPGALAVLATFPNVNAATGLTESIHVDRLGLHACLVPHRAVRRPDPPIPDPDPRKRWNVLVLHAAHGSDTSEGLRIDASDWDYVALGGEHQRRTVQDRVRYPGSLERVALDPWSEAADEKGFLIVDIESGRTEFHAIRGRPVVALAPVKIRDTDPDKLVRKVREVMNEVPGGIVDKIVRLRVQGARPHDLLALQGEPLRSLRSEALHLAVEAGKDLHLPRGSASPDENLEHIRKAVAAELERDGAGPEALQRSSEVLTGTLAPAPTAHGAIDALDGEVAGGARISTSIPEGMTAVLGGGGRTRRAIAELYLRAGASGPPGAIRQWWSTLTPETLDGALRRAVAAVAESRGVDLIDGALDALGTAAPSSAEPTPELERPATGAVRIDPELVAAELEHAQRELLDMRAEAVETGGDLEVATMDWHRERQDAETTLFAYRDRARELRSRIKRMESAGPDAPCPTCGRVLEAHYDEVLEELRDEWESVVQDGGWWRSRWEQLEPKPVHLQELERRALTLHAGIEAGSERVELLRARLEELEGVRTRTPRPDLDGVDGAVVDALLRVREARSARAAQLLLDRASRFVTRISGGRILAITWEEGVVHLQGTSGALAPMSEEDLAMGRVAIRLAAASLIAARGRVLRSLLIEQPFDQLDQEARIRTLVLTKKLLREVPRVLLFSRGEVVEARPELFDFVLEVRDEGAAAGPLVRPAPAGPGSVILARAGRAARVQPTH
ncbi:MAG: metallophosphoesterase [Gemmatimonadota bacterium]